MCRSKGLRLLWLVVFLFTPLRSAQLGYADGFPDARDRIAHFQRHLEDFDRDAALAPEPNWTSILLNGQGIFHGLANSTSPEELAQKAALIRHRAIGAPPHAAKLFGLLLHGTQKYGVSVLSYPTGAYSKELDTYISLSASGKGPESPEVRSAVQKIVAQLESETSATGYGVRLKLVLDVLGQQPDPAAPAFEFLRKQFGDPSDPSTWETAELMERYYQMVVGQGDTGSPELAELARKIMWATWADDGRRESIVRAIVGRAPDPDAPGFRLLLAQFIGSQEPATQKLFEHLATFYSYTTASTIDYNSPWFKEAEKGIVKEIVRSKTVQEYRKKMDLLKAMHWVHPHKWSLDLWNLQGDLLTAFRKERQKRENAHSDRRLIYRLAWVPVGGWLTGLRQFATDKIRGIPDRLVGVEEPVFAPEFLRERAVTEVPKESGTPSEDASRRDKQPAADFVLEPVDLWALGLEASETGEAVPTDQPPTANNDPAGRPEESEISRERDPVVPSSSLVEALENALVKDGGSE